MNIMAPLLNFNDIEQFSEAGADELYFGTYDLRWNNLFGEFEEMNRMSSFSKSANVSIDEADSYIKRIHQFGKKAFITLNSAIYSAKQREYLINVLNFLSDADGFIVSDIELMKVLIRKGHNVTASTMCGCYNSLIIKFYEDLGIKRVILPRDININNIENIVRRFPNLDFEAFIMRNGCKYSDSRCLSFHSRDCGSMCFNTDNSDFVFFFDKKCSTEFKREAYADHKLYSYVFHKQACGLCAVEEFNRIGIKSLKIVGRADNPAEVIKDIKSLKSCANGINIEDYENCLYGLNCYYNTYTNL